MDQQDINCAACRKLFNKKDYYLQCSLCKEKYHIQCLNITNHQFARLNETHTTTWKCPSCSNITNRRKSNTNTPIRKTQLPVYEDSMDMSCENIHKNTSIDSCDISPTLQSRSTAPPSNNASQQTVTHVELMNFTQDLKSTLDSWRHSMEASMTKISDDIKNTLTGIQKDLNSLRAEQTSLKQEVTGLSQEISDIKLSVQFQAGENGDLKRQVDEITKKLQLTDNHNTLSNLESKIDSLEQQARQCNIEISNIPERRNENLLVIIESIGKSINYPITPSDIVSAHRVPHANKENNRPKNIVLKVASRSGRDNILSAYRKCKELKTDRLGISGVPQRIYLNEHLTLKKKQLFRLCRDAARKNNFKYVWIKNATILVRESDNAPAIAIRSDGDIEKIVCKRSS